MTYGFRAKAFGNETPGEPKLNWRVGPAGIEPATKRL